MDYCDLFYLKEKDFSLDSLIDSALRPLADGLDNIIFYPIKILNYDVPIIVLWLIIAASFFTFYFNFLNIRGFGHAIRVVKGDYKGTSEEGEISYFQALMTALSGTIGIGNIGGVAIVISIGGPGAVFWLIVAGLLGMSTKFIECVLGVKYRKINKDGSISGGPMYYLERGLRAIGLGKVGKPLGLFYALAIVIGCLGTGNMFQANQAFQQFVFVTGSENSFFADKGWLFGLIIALAVGSVIIGGLKRIARTTSTMVPFMAIAYLLFAVSIITLNSDKILWALGAIVTEAFNSKAMAGGVVGVIILGFQRAVFSNEAGMGSAAIAHSAVRTKEPVREGFVGLLEPFIDTVIICTITSLVILTTVYEPGMQNSNIQGIELTSQAFASTLSWSVVPLSIIAILFAFSTLISWSYYGLKGWTYLFGENKSAKNIFKIIFCLFTLIGCTIQLESVLKFSDAMVFLVALPNIIGLYLLAPIVKKELKKYQKKMKAG
ncbi:alanine/glycine:cation symporter family protein [Croceitalea sp. MTPC9]|uniref:alanine/glycine:cation symporter family protein n=1 Tax=unclassified Croceitalea TaxID=2632280 RepID=UPI002B379968|nr:alanine/glycine:cation symporter family protein [Croceitalea sp. MTPC6]GMN16138.1 alanine/glycine:cation symporter family protein [Croceitalea sp. MTPC9]